MGADHVRLPIDFECIETESGEPLPFGYVSISECIEWCEKYGLNVILDVHKTAGFSFDSKQNTLFDSEPLKLRYLKLWEMLSYQYLRGFINCSDYFYIFVKIVEYCLLAILFCLDFQFHS